MVFLYVSVGITMVLERPKKYKEKISVYSGKRRKVVYEDVPSVIKAESLLENVDEPQEPIATTSCVPDNTNSTCTTSQKCKSNQVFTHTCSCIAIVLK